MGARPVALMVLAAALAAVPAGTAAAGTAAAGTAAAGTAAAGTAAAGTASAGTAAAGTAAAGGGGSGFTVAGGPTGDLTLPPGQVVVADYTVVNTSGRPEQIAVAVTGLHFDGQTPEFTGSPSPGLSVVARPTALELGPGASQGVNLSVEALPASPPGGLYAGVVFKEVPPPSSGSTTIEEAQARPLIGHVPGPTTDTGRIVSFASPTATARPGRVVFDLTFLDTGDIDYLLGGSVALVSSSGSSLGTGTVPRDTVLPANPRVVPVAFTDPVPAGEVTAALHLTWGTSEEHSGTAVATVVVSGAGSGANDSGGTNQAGPTPGRQRVIQLTRSQDHPDSWVFRGLALLLLLILIALLIRRYLQRRRTAKRLRAETRAGP